jgi:hypothetical protein
MTRASRTTLLFLLTFGGSTRRDRLRGRQLTFPPDRTASPFATWSGCPEPFTVSSAVDGGGLKNSMLLLIEGLLDAELHLHEFPIELLGGAAES